MVAPVFYRTEKTKNFLSSLMYTDYETINFKLIIAVNAADASLTKFIKKWQSDFGKLHGDSNIEVLWHKENLGKGKAINQAVKQFEDEVKPNFIVSMDSDIVHIDRLWLRKSIQTFSDYNEHYKNNKKVKALGLMSPNMLSDKVSMNNHYIGRIPAYDIKVKNWSCWTSDKNTGIAGPCFVIDYNAWKKIGGYYDALYIGGNDAHMLYDLHLNDYHAIINKDIYFIHPHDDKNENEYREWKSNMINHARKRPRKLPSHLSDYKGKKTF